MTDAAPRTAGDYVPDPLCGHSMSLNITAPPDRVWHALQSVRFRDTPLTAGLLAVRTLPSTVAKRRFGATRRSLAEPIIETMQRTRFTLLHVEPAAIVTLGIIGQFWKPRGGRDAPINGSEDFVAFAEPGFIKSAVDFQLEGSSGGTLLSTETWNVATDQETARTFRRYWRAIGWGSRLIRHDMLRAVSRSILERADNT